MLDKRDRGTIVAVTCDLRKAGEAHIRRRVVNAFEPVAQSVEHVTFNHGVAGSIPAGLATKTGHFLRFGSSDEGKPGRRSANIAKLPHLLRKPYLAQALIVRNEDRGRRVSHLADPRRGSLPVAPVARIARRLKQRRNSGPHGRSRDLFLIMRSPPCRKRSRIRSERGGRKPQRYWESLERYHWRAAHPGQPSVRRATH